MSECPPLAGLMWSAEGRSGRKTHIFLVEHVEDDWAIICKDPRAQYFGWDGDLPTETPAGLLKRIEKTDADEMVCLCCVKALRRAINE